MVKGIESFKEWFRGFEDNYVVIGGTACDLLLGEAGQAFRGTRDIDMVLIVEHLTAEFGARLWEYIKMGGYKQRVKSTGTPEYYRFMKPISLEYPSMIELFSRRAEGITLPPDAVLTPLPVDDEISSLSAILLDDTYYSFMRAGITMSEGISVLGVAYLIPFKAKAWLDLTERKVKGQQIDSKNIRKHKNDIIHLSTILSENFSMILPNIIEEDMRKFLANVEEKEKYTRVATVYNIV